MINKLYKCPPLLVWLIFGGTIVFWGQDVHGAILVPTSLSGSISYGYGYNKTLGEVESESQSLTFTIGGTGFIWQPWFIQGGVGLNLDFTRESSSTSRDTSNGRNIGGNLDLNVFPVSRFPFSLSVSHGNTRNESGQAFAGISAYETTSTLLFARQGYYPKSGYYNDFSWSHSEVDTFSSSSVSDSLSAETRKSGQVSSWSTSANYNVIDISNSNSRPENFGLRFSHNYLPGNQTTIMSDLSGWRTQNKGGTFTSESQSAQASSSFSWRPEYRPYSFSGGARISASDSQQRSLSSESEFKSNAASLSLGMDYRINRKMSVVLVGTGTGSFDESDNSKTTSTTGNAGVTTSYNSDSYSVGGFQYDWNANGGAGATYDKTEQSGGVDTSTSETASTVSLGLGHRISRGWSVGRATSMNGTLAQSVSGSGSSDGTMGWGTGLGGDLSGSSRSIGGTTFGGVSLWYSYDKSSFEDSQEDIEFQSQYARANFSRNQNINRLSALTFTATSEWRRQQAVADDTVTRSADASVDYRHQRFLGIYALQFDSVASYYVSFNPDEEQLDSMDWRNTWRYSIGLLDLSLYFDMSRTGDAPTSGSLYFRATRSF